jgi:hypothetical protein
LAAAVHLPSRVKKGGATRCLALESFWLKDDSLADSDKLPPPDVIAQEIVDDLEAALEQFRLIAGAMGGAVEASF